MIFSEFICHTPGKAVITGSIAEEAYGISDWIKEKAYAHLDDRLKDVLNRWQEYLEKSADLG